MQIDILGNWAAICFTGTKLFVAANIVGQLPVTAAAKGRLPATIDVRLAGIGSETRIVGRQRLEAVAQRHRDRDRLISKIGIPCREVGWALIGQAGAEAGIQSINPRLRAQRFIMTGKFRHHFLDCLF